MAVRILNSGSRESNFREAAGKVCSDIISEHGTCRIEYTDNENDDGSWNLSGLSYIKQMDFNADGKEELLVAYKDESTYIIEVWGFKGKSFTNLYKDKANFIDSYKNLGKWITFYRNGSKCYLGKLKENSTEEMELLTLKGNKFIVASSCAFNPEEMSYSVNGSRNIVDFETIKLSCLTSARAEYYQNYVNNTIGEFVSEKYVNANVPLTDEQKKAQAFCRIIETQTQKYGTAAVSSTKNSCFADGAAVIRLVDFNGDGEEELFVISRNQKHFDDTDASPRYVMDVFLWDGTTAKKIYESEQMSSYFDNNKSDIFYILQKKDGRINICCNTYSYGENPDKTWRAVSTINEMTSLNGFETTFTAILNNKNGYKNYRINGKSVYKREFTEDAYVVPYFCNEENYSSDEFEITLLNTDKNSSNKIESLIAETEKTVKGLYSASGLGNTAEN